MKRVLLCQEPGLLAAGGAPGRTRAPGDAGSAGPARRDAREPGRSRDDRDQHRRRPRRAPGDEPGREGDVEPDRERGHADRLQHEDRLGVPGRACAAGAVAGSGPRVHDRARLRGLRSAGLDAAVVLPLRRGADAGFGAARQVVGLPAGRGEEAADGRGRREPLVRDDLPQLRGDLGSARRDPAGAVRRGWRRRRRHQARLHVLQTRS